MQDHIITCVLTQLSTRTITQMRAQFMLQRPARMRGRGKGQLRTSEGGDAAAIMLVSAAVARGSRQQIVKRRYTHKDTHGGITKWQGCGDVDNCCLGSTPLFAQQTAATDAGGKGVRRTRGRAQTARDRQTAQGERGKCEAFGEGVAPTAAGRQSARLPRAQESAGSTAAAHPPAAPAPAQACCCRRTSSGKRSPPLLSRAAAHRYATRRHAAPAATAIAADLPPALPGPGGTTWGGRGVQIRYLQNRPNPPKKGAWVPAVAVCPNQAGGFCGSHNSTSS
jgi:hypothetical protein